MTIDLDEPGNGAKAMTVGQAMRSGTRIEAELNKIREQQAMDSVLLALESAITGLSEYAARRSAFERTFLPGEGGPDGGPCEESI